MDPRAHRSTASGRCTRTGCRRSASSRRSASIGCCCSRPRRVHDGRSEDDRVIGVTYESGSLPSAPPPYPCGRTGSRLGGRRRWSDAGRGAALLPRQCRAVNRRGATPLHYAVGGVPGSTRWDPDAQAATIELLVEAGGDREAADKSGVAPLHVAVRSRCASAVQSLLVSGADPRRKNKSGSTPLHLAVQTTGRGGSGSAAAKEAAGRDRPSAHRSRCTSNRPERARQDRRTVRSRCCACRTPALARTRTRIRIRIRTRTTRRTAAGDGRCASTPTAATRHATWPRKSDAWPIWHPAVARRTAA